MLIVTCLSTVKHDQRGRRSVLAFHLLKCLLQRDMKAASLEAHQFAFLCPRWVPAAGTLWQVWLEDLVWVGGLRPQTSCLQYRRGPPLSQHSCYFEAGGGWAGRVGTGDFLVVNRPNFVWNQVAYKYGLKQIRGYTSNLLNQRQFIQLNFEVLYFYVQVTNLKARWMNQSYYQACLTLTPLCCREKHRLVSLSLAWKMGNQYK